MTKADRVKYIKAKIIRIDKELAEGNVTHDRMLKLKDNRIIAMRDLLSLTGQNLSDTNIGVGGSSIHRAYQQGYGYKGKKF